MLWIVTLVTSWPFVSVTMITEPLIIGVVVEDTEGLGETVGLMVVEDDGVGVGVADGVAGLVLATGACVALAAAGASRLVVPEKSALLQAKAPRTLIQTSWFANFMMTSPRG